MSALSVEAVRRRAREAAEQAPALTDEQRERLRALLRPAPAHRAQRAA